MNRTTIVALILGGILIALVWKATRNALWSFLSMVIVLFGAGVALLYFKIPISAGAKIDRITPRERREAAG